MRIHHGLGGEGTLMTDTRFCSIRPVLSMLLAICGLLMSAGALAEAIAAPFAYIPNNSSNSVSVIDTATNAVVGTVGVGRSPQHVAVHPAGTFVYITHDTSLSVIDTESRAVTATREFGASVSAVAVHPAGTYLYVAVAPGSIAVIDVTTFATVAKIAVGGYPSGLAMHPTGHLLYVATGNLVVIDTASRTASNPIQLSPTPVFWLAVHPDGTRLYAVDYHSDRVLSVDARTYAVVGTLRIPMPASAAVNGTGSRLYVTSSGHHTMSVVDTASFTGVATLDLGAGAQPIGVAVHPSGQLVYVANTLFDTVSVIDAVGNTVLGSIPVGRYPVAFGHFIAPAKAVDLDAALAAAEARILDLETQLAGAKAEAALATAESERRQNAIVLARATIPALETEVATLTTSLADMEGLRAQLQMALAGADAKIAAQGATVRSLVHRLFGLPADANAAVAAGEVAEAQVIATVAGVGAADRQVARAVRSLEAGRAALERRDYRSAVKAFDHAFDAATRRLDRSGLRAGE